MNILICGGSNFKYEDLVFETLNNLTFSEVLILGSGKAATSAIEWCKSHNKDFREINYAPPLHVNSIDLILAFPEEDDSTSELIKEAYTCKIKVIEIGRRIYVDMDDVLCDFNSAYSLKKAATPDKKSVKIDSGFFLGLNPLEGSIDGINQLSNFFEVWILTAPFYNIASCYTEKRLWVEKHLGGHWHKRLIICPNKNLMIGDYLIDDNLWPGFMGKQLVFGQRECLDWKAVLKSFGVYNQVETRRKTKKKNKKKTESSPYKNS